VAGPERGAACTRGRAGRWSTCAKRWAGYTRFLDDPSLPLDNNLAARLLRTPVLCRKNWGLIGAAWAAAFAAALWTVVETAKRNGCNPLTYLIAYFEACAARGGQPLEGAELERFLPWALSPADRAARPSARPAALPVGLTLPPAAPAGRCAQGLRNRRGPAVWSPRSAMRPQLPRRSRCPGPRRPRPAQELRLGKRRASRPTGSPSRPAGCRGPTQCRAVRSRRPRQPRPPCRGTVRLPPSRQDGGEDVAGGPVGGQAADGLAEEAGGQVFDPDPGQDQERRLVDDEMQAGHALLGVPPDEAVAGGDLRPVHFGVLKCGAPRARGPARSRR